MIDIYHKVNYNNIFKILISIWILSIPFKNVIFQISILLIPTFFAYYLFKTKQFSTLIANLKETKYLFVGFCFIVFSMILSNLLNPEFLDKKSWHTIYMFVIRYGLIFVILAYFYRLEFFTKKEILVLVVFSLSVLLCTGIYQILQEPTVIIKEGITGTLNNRNAFGLMMGMGVVLSLCLIKYKRIFALFFLLLFSFFMIFSFCRSSWVASFSATAIFCLLNYKQFRLKHLGFLALFLGFLLILYFSFDSFQTRFAQLLEGNSSGRTMIWQHTIVLIEKSLFVGYGMDSWKNLGDEFLLQYPDSHNMILEILIKTGVIGLIACFFTIGVVLIKIFKTKNYILLPIATYFLVITQFDFGAFGSKELLSFLTIFVFYLYSDSFKLAK